MKLRKNNIIIVCSLVLTALSIAWWRSIAIAAVAAPAETVSASGAQIWVLRLHPGDDLVDSIMAFARKHSIQAGGVVTCVGSLKRARLRYANQNEYEDLGKKGEHFKIVSLVGTFSTTGRHLHLSVANERGEVFGGHAGPGNKVYTTAEIILVEGKDWRFPREKDPDTTFEELFPVQRQHENGVESAFRASNNLNRQGAKNAK